MPLELLVTLGVFAPLLGAAIAGFFGRRIGDIPSQAVTTGLLFFSCAVAWTVFSQWTWGHLEPFTVTIAPFINVGDFQSAWSIRIDALSAVMLVVVTSVSSLVHLYSWGYMAEDDSRPRFFAYLSLFTFAMLALVTAADFMQLFFGWEGVGLASYLLIGFWFKKSTASAAAIKAFVVNRVGDFGFALGIITVFWMFGTIEFAELFPLIAAKQGQGWEFLGHTWSALDLAGVLLFVGAMGKSAQFFLHTWLPDAMEGPTPVSALIHAATMVTAGVYMVCLLSPIYEYAPTASLLIAITGAVTALFAATVGLMQNDIKRVIAYSTCSQLGYMFFAAGVGVYESAMFHLFTHAFFKALLFLGAGSVIHGMHHEQDMRKMGGLWKLLPVTYAVMMIGTIAITGLGIPEIGGFAGFYSKDSIIESAYAAATSGHSAAGYFAFFVGIFAAGLTSYYSWRLIFMTFHNKPAWKEDAHAHAHGHDDHAAHPAQLETHSEPLPDDHAHDDHGHGHHGPMKPHESPWVMLVPLILLSVGAVAAGFVFAPDFIGHHETEFWRGAIFNGPDNHVLHESHEVPLWVKWSPLVVTLLGAAIAAYYYVLREGLAKRMAEKEGPLWTFLYNKWFFDELYDLVFVKGAKALGDFFWKVCDVRIIDGLGPNGAAWGSLKSAGWLSKFQSGYVYYYAFVMLIGVAGLLAFAIYTWGA
ncbi:NADH-quinone oxidoreductase subunit L [Brevundimonas subvibrioides]|uniref:Proton-translocating NADH-quinone oxidoreductase, chain L n=1 Tax=Brevundimonas subvibrioides (strain ATCC 15264 / DSM 4735 / LMG 14903 / NBRC 16000 / CB 81) TaxID=633149 RepID=D9QI03_BRESC|nr:NADH-quinone oxidoreductase subunit L [Brevundimonas subvibrioides]ADL01261.1 proton-translocating NADH-quinone oxidoreductase, chain L [Brevundimonas subvibrioides ATCC 15264]